MTTLTRKGRPPKVVALSNKEFSVTVKGSVLKFEKGITGLRRTDRNAGVSKDEIDYAKGVVKKYLKDKEADAAHRSSLPEAGY